MTDNLNLIELTSDIVSSHVTNNQVAVGDIPQLIRQVHGALSGLGGTPATVEQDKKVPAVSVKASIKPDYLTCLECGRKQKTLKRHLQSAHGMTPAEYRKAFGLPADYPMTASAYSERRSNLAKAIGLGSRSRIEASPAPANPRGRKRKDAGGQ